MAGMGPPPKDPKTRQRGQRHSSAAQFETTEQAQKRPPLGKHPVKGKRWHPRTQAFWREIWASPLSKEYLRVDLDGLMQLTVLVDRFWHDPSPQLAAEIRLQRLNYGLTPMDRRRLQWEIVRATDAQAKHPPRKPEPKLPPGDPRAALRAI